MLSSYHYRKGGSIKKALFFLLFAASWGLLSAFFLRAVMTLGTALSAAPAVVFKSVSAAVPFVLRDRVILLVGLVVLSIAQIVFCSLCDNHSYLYDFFDYFGISASIVFLACLINLICCLIGKINVLCDVFTVLVLPFTYTLVSAFLFTVFRHKADIIDDEDDEWDVDWDDDYYALDEDEEKSDGSDGKADKEKEPASGNKNGKNGTEEQKDKTAKVKVKVNRKKRSQKPAVK